MFFDAPEMRLESSRLVAIGPLQLGIDDLVSLEGELGGICGGIVVESRFGRFASRLISWMTVQGSFPHWISLAPAISELDCGTPARSFNRR